MNHDNELKTLGEVLKIIIVSYRLEIAAIKDPKHRTELIQELDKMEHYMIKMTKCLDDMNCWFTAFGADGNAQNS
jgi:hypothetical protein